MGYTKDEVVDAGCAAWWRRGPLMEPSFLFVGNVFFSLSPTGGQAPVGAAEVPEGGWEHHSSCSCALCAQAQRHTVSADRHATAEDLPASR